MNENVLIIIPARGGSKGIPKKNIRPLNNKPLIWYSINNALNLKYKCDVYVSSDDDEILFISKSFGAKVHKRNLKLSDDITTLDPVIYNAYKEISKKNSINYNIIVTLQPTSPCLSISSIEKGIDLILSDSKIDTIISATDDTHLSWSVVKQNEYIPNYKERVNRQFLPKNLKETGGFLISRSCVVNENSRIGKNIKLLEVNKNEAIDIDNYHDWNLCEYLLKRKRIVFVVLGNKELGLGHVYNTLILAHEILNHEICFFVLKDSELAYEKIKSNFFEVHLQKTDNLIAEINSLNPNLIINDILDTDDKYINELKKLNLKVINFEDLGNGAQYADLVFNAIYPEKNTYKNHFYGQKYYCSRYEFIESQTNIIKKDVKNILITFGGVDPNNLTLKVLDSVYDFCVSNEIKIDVITGPGYKNNDTLKKFKDNITLNNNVNNISKFMLNADIVFISSGRTTFEVACIGTPAIVIAQNKRETTHFFASKEYGFLNLGLCDKITSQLINDKFVNLVNNYDLRQEMSSLMLKNDLKTGKKKVVSKILSLIGEDYET